MEELVLKFLKCRELLKMDRFDAIVSEFLAHNLVELESCGSVANMVVACAYEVFDENPKRKCMHELAKP